MPVMSKAEAWLCRSAPWRSFASRVVLPWAVRDHEFGQNVLEIGGGAGAMADVNLREHSMVDLTITDLDPEMLERATRRLARFVGRAHTELADCTALPFDDATFDTVVSFIMLHHVGDWRSALPEMHRVLRPGGTILGYDLTDTRLARGFHQIDRSQVSMLNPRDLLIGLTDADFVSPAVTSHLGGHVMRFDATKSAGEGISR